MSDPDDDAAAIARVVDRLLASPHFGETWARHWLDLVRYADTLGHEFDYPLPYAWRYRDYVIRAFNNDIPWNEFIREHIAGDLMDSPRRHPVEHYNESVIGTGFWFLHEAKHAPVDVQLDEVVRLDNQVDVFSRAFLGLTVACARCHDHKFDAVSTSDYYALTGILVSSRRCTAWLDPGREIEQRVAVLERLSRAAETRLTELREADLRAGTVTMTADTAALLAAANEAATLGVDPSTDSAEGSWNGTTDRSLHSEVIGRWVSRLHAAQMDPATDPVSLLAQLAGLTSPEQRRTVALQWARNVATAAARMTRRSVMRYCVNRSRTTGMPRDRHSR